MTIHEAADKLGVTTAAIYKWIRDQRLKADRSRRPWIITQANLDALKRPRRGRPEKLTRCPKCHHEFHA